MAQTLDDLWNMAVLSMIYGYLTIESLEFHVFFGHYREHYWERLDISWDFLVEFNQLNGDDITLWLFNIAMEAFFPIYR
jgi:hypothetical protein